MVAYRYEKAGFRIVPVPVGGKSPRVGGFGKENPTFTVDAVDFHDDDRVAILCGPSDAGQQWELTCLDLDGAFGNAELIEALGELPPTLTSKGGKHRYYWVPDVPARERVKQWVKLASCEGGGLDFKWRGGYAIENGDWDVPFDPSLIAQLPLEALDRVIALGERARADEAPRRSELIATLAKVWPQESGRYESALALGGILARSELSEDECADLAQQIFDAANVSDRTEQVLASVGEVRAGGSAYGWPKLKEHMIGSKQLKGRACNALSKFLGIDKETRKAREAGTPAAGDVIRDPELFQAKELRVRELEEILARRALIFQQAQRLIRVQPTSRLPGEGEPLGPVALNLPMLQCALSEGPERFWKVERNEKGERHFEIDPPQDDCTALLVKSDWSFVAPLRGIAHCPFMRPDGSICTEGGYDQRTGWYLEPKFELPEPVPASPTLADAQRALECLVLPFREFPWEQPNHALLPLSLVLSGLARAAIGDVPCHALDASTPGTGKTLALDAAAVILTGAIVAKSTFPATEEELEKVLAADALAGRRIIGFDNLSPSRKFGGESLERALSCGGRVALRVLGKTEKPELPWNAIVTGSGNNLQLSHDMRRRTLVGRLIAPIERPEERTGFAIENLIGWTRANRPALVLAGLTLLRAFVVAGRPRQSAALGGYESWSELVADALQWVSGADVRQLRHSAGSDASESMVGQMFRCIAALTAQGALSAKQLLAVAYDRHEADALGLREAFGELIQARGPSGTKASAVQVGKLLGRHRDQIRSGVRLIAFRDNVGATFWMTRPG
jgi:hypothetical protein